MRTLNFSEKLLLVAIFGLGVWGCGNSSGVSSGSGGATSAPAGSGGSLPGASGGGPAGTGGASATVPNASGGVLSSGGAPGSGGSVATGGSTIATGGSAAGGGATTGGKLGTGGARTGGTGAGGAATGGTNANGGGTAAAGDCTIGAWPTADPSKAGPYTTVTENDVGPEAGAGVDGGTPPKFTMFRPKDMLQGGLCHPVITWGNGTGATPNMYRTLLNQFASHGFVVIASNNTNVAQGNPAPMLVGVTWVLEQNDDTSSVLYHRIDTTHIGATGHSQGAMATTQASGDSRITTSVPIEGASAQRNLHGPAMFFCGGQDTIVGCSGAQSALNAVTTLPAMFAELLSVDHGSWMSRGSTLSASDTAFTAWMRVHLMGDDSLRSWFYGASCKLCTDTAWQIDRKNMDQ